MMGDDVWILQVVEVFLWTKPNTVRVTELGRAKPFFLPRGPKCSLNENYKRHKHFGSLVVQVNLAKH